MHRNNITLTIVVYSRVTLIFLKFTLAVTCCMFFKLYDSVPFTAVPGFLIPYLKTIIEKWFIRLLPMPYAVLKLLPGDEAARAWGK